VGPSGMPSEGSSERSWKEAIPAVLIAGTHSGVGKTTITLGLMAALRARGLVVQPFKVGPDFIDPSHHTAICGRPSLNLDPFMMGEEGVRRSFFSALGGADVAVVEGVMGLFDGMGGTEIGSSAQVAKILDIPVLLVINVHGMSRSAAAMELGFSSYDPGVKLAGTILNRVGSPRHLDMLRSCLRSPIFGALPRDKEIGMKSRHLGLVMGFEKDHDPGLLASILERNADIDAILSLPDRVRPPAMAGSAEQYDAAAVRTVRAASTGRAANTEIAEKAGGSGREGKEGAVRIGVAKDRAFCFYYHENLLELERQGAELVYFSPLEDQLPDVGGLYIGGGYPELYASELERAPAKRQIKEASEDEMPIYGECGGLMYLGESLESEAGSFRMVGALPVTTFMEKRLMALGYVEAEFSGSNPLADVGRSLRGHEFHYSRCECDRDARCCLRLSRGKGIGKGKDGLVEKNTMAGYLHAHFYSLSVEKFVEGCVSYNRT